MNDQFRAEKQDAVPIAVSHSRREIGGIPAYSAPAGIRYSGGLVFRVGRADETARTGGISHIVEHLALFGLGPHQPYPYNGSVTGLTTSFVATGNPEEVGRFLTEVARGLRNLPMQRLLDEARVLRTEASRRSSGPAQALLWLRYGATGHGLHQMPEYGLLNPDPRSASAWAAERFTASNAALWFTGPPPPGLALDLPVGKRFEAPPLVPRPSLQLPTWATWRQNLVAISFVVPRKAGFNFLLTVASRRVSTKLRFEKGISYEIGGAYEPITRDEAHAALWASCLPEHARTVRDGIVGVFDDLAANGATPEELSHAREAFRRSWTDPDALPHELSSLAVNELLGFPVESLAEIVAEYGAIDGPEVARRIASAQASAYLLIPVGCPPPSGRFVQSPPRPSQSVSGKTFRIASARYPWSRGERLVIGPDGVSAVSSDKKVNTIRFDSCAVAIEHKNGNLEMFAEQGTWIAIDPRRWHRGHEAVRMLKGALPQDRVVRPV